MPYITQQRRTDLCYDLPQTAGELNYILTGVLQDYLSQKGESYQTYNDMLGALEGAKLELYRRKIAPYEDIKMKENGDAWS